MEVRLRFTISALGHDPENGERAMAGFMTAFAEGGPAVSQNTETGTLTITFAFDAGDARDAIDKGVQVFIEGCRAAGFGLPDVIDLEASVVPVEDDVPARELQPA